MAGRIWLVGPRYQKDSEQSLDTLPPNEPVLYIDGGTHFRPDTSNQMPPEPTGFALGDGDSWSGQLDETLPAEKNYSDLAYALANIPAQFTEIHLLGFLGGRRDHEWINLGEAHQFLALRHKPTRLYFDARPTEQIIGFSAGSWQFHHHGIFSLICLAPAKITLNGDCQYPLDHPTPLNPLSSHGLSNRGEGDITLSSDQVIFFIAHL